MQPSLGRSLQAMQLHLFVSCPQPHTRLPGPHPRHPANRCPETRPSPLTRPSPIVSILQAPDYCSLAWLSVSCSVREGGWGIATAFNGTLELARAEGAHRCFTMERFERGRVTDEVDPEDGPKGKET